MNFKLSNYMRILYIIQVNQIYDISAYATQFRCMIHKIVYLHKYNMIFTDFTDTYCLVNSPMKTMDHMIVSSYDL